LAVLASGGNALEAAIAANLTLGVVAPYLCGYGGDLFALVWTDTAVGYNGSGRAPKAATLDSVRTAAGSDEMPYRGPLTVTVPGAVEAWFALLRRFATRSFADLAQPALRYAREGFPLTARAAQSISLARDTFADSPAWQAVYGRARSGVVLRQPDLARTIEMLCADGPDAYYRGPIAEATAQHVQAAGGFIGAQDLAEHQGDWMPPLSAGYRGVDVVELPPNTQGVSALEALNIVEAAGDLPPDGAERQHLLIEATKRALADRDLYVTDPEHMRIPPDALASKEWAVRRAHTIDADRATSPDPAGAELGDTAYVCAADEGGMLVGLIQSNYAGFGSGITVPGWGINLQNRGASFSLHAGHVNVIAPRKRTMHTLIPAMALRGGRPWLVFGTMGGHGQAQTHLQLLVRLIDDGEDVQEAITAPRWMVSPNDWSVAAEDRFRPEVIGALRRRGHRLLVREGFDSLLGHAHAIVVGEPGYAAATDPRAEGAVVGL
jgi:gamma-glutamyltranspeptidase / glutathione hydrolase